MKTNAIKRISAMTAPFCLAFGVGYGLHAYADGAPTLHPLWYSGTVLDDKGAPLNGSHTIDVRLFTDQTAGAALCNASQTLMLSAGRFRMALPDSCRDAIAHNPDLYVEVEVDAMGPFNRSKLGAAPYAIEAQHALNAEQAESAKHADVANSSDHSTLIAAWKADPDVKMVGLEDNKQLDHQTTKSSWRRVGDSVEVQIQTGFSDQPSQGSGGLGWTLPLGLHNDEEKQPRLTDGPIGIAIVRRGADLICIPYTAGYYVILACPNEATPIGPSGFVAGSYVSLHITVPAAGWTD